MMLIKEIHENILIVTLNRPDKRNALNPELIKQLHEIVLEFKSKHELFGMLIAGSGPVFCAGADLEYLESLLNKSYEEHLEDSRRIKNLFYEIYSLPRPVVALVNGSALAGGCGLMNVCDYALAVPDARFGYPEVKIGFTAAIVSVFLMHSIGFHRTKQLLIEGEIFDSRKAFDLGLIHEVVDASELLKKGFELMGKLKNNSWTSIAVTKNLLLQINQEQLKASLEMACEANARARLNPDFKEGIQSFLEKRKPQWGSGA